MTEWRVEHVSGSAHEVFHGPVSSASLVSAHIDAPVVRFIKVDASVLVLGSGQSSSIVGAVPEVVKRRSGGGAVWLDPAEQIWVDVLVPVTHRLWDADITRSFDWLGKVWAQTLRALGVTQTLNIHTGPMVNTDWSKLLCFAGRGPGEVFVNDRKLVGLSQRRGRAGSLFQCGLLLKWTFDQSWFDPAHWPSEPDLRVTHAGIGLDELGQFSLSRATISQAFISALTLFTQ
jgi:lipoate---protein ligase